MDISKNADLDTGNVAVLHIFMGSPLARPMCYGTGLLPEDSWGSIIARYAHRPWGRMTVTYGIGPLHTLTDRYARYRTIPDHPQRSPAVPSKAERLLI